MFYSFFGTALPLVNTQYMFLFCPYYKNENSLWIFINFANHLCLFWSGQSSKKFFYAHLILYQKRFNIMAKPPENKSLTLVTIKILSRNSTTWIFPVPTCRPHQLAQKTSELFFLPLLFRLSNSTSICLSRPNPWFTSSIYRKRISSGKRTNGKPTQ